MKSLVTSYNGLFKSAALNDNALAVDRIEIPIIQRDYAQGRDTSAVARIRANFLSVLHAALTSTDPGSLDFIYGDVVEGTLRPLDGQQRLTTLFLLHWYVAWRANRLDQEQGWKRFEYATRPGARRFCKCLTQSNPPIDACLRQWFEDQPWFLHTWYHDPSIQSMLVMIDAIHERFSDMDHLAAWDRLVDSANPAISFHLLPTREMDLGDDLYIKMNSRGKPLTHFENFKARFEQLLEHAHPERLEEFSRKIDGSWADVMWPFRGNDDIVDDEFLNYFQFVTDICEWRDGRSLAPDIDTAAERCYGSDNEKSAAHLDFLIRCFDTWVNSDIDVVFSNLFSPTSPPDITADRSKVVLFGASAGSQNLLADCLGRGQRAGILGSGRLGWPRTLLLYGVLLHRLEATAHFAERVRVLRNLIEASSSELRAAWRIIVDGDLKAVSTFNQTQVSDELLKVGLLEEASHLRQHVLALEDHQLLRGCLTAFEYDARVFESRSRAFYEIFADPKLLPLLTGALLAAGDYSLRINERFVQFASSSDLVQWRNEILTGSSRMRLEGVRGALGRVLDAVAAFGGDAASALKSISEQWLGSVDETKGYDWRWYFVKYSEMRRGHSGIYAYAGGSLGYDVCMLEKRAMSSYYRDPYLSAIRHYGGVPDTAVQGRVATDRPDGPWFTGYETEERWMRIVASGVSIRCVEDGFQLRASEESVSNLSDIYEAHGIGSDLCLRIPQIAVGPRRFDTKDRVALGAALVRDLANGLA
jgi:hypothetical protein